MASHRHVAHLDEIAFLTCNIGEIYRMQNKKGAVNNYRQSLTMFQSQQQLDKSNVHCDPSTKLIRDVYDPLGDVHYGTKSNEERLG